ncbi:peptidase M61 [Sphingosinicella sp. CPCC 101087]|uniref:peptidase M61 n=1 Tax=Sphingosinicella sp. CPCC 101087 TaxID=2497754 RepID=UPI001FB0A4B5|nr:peptidase M61 [Sphingosinicella sp. CPCC 101087]
MRPIRGRLLGAMLAGAGTATAAFAQSGEAPRLAVELKPLPETGSREIGQLDVTLTFDAPVDEVRLPLVVNNVETVATRLTGLDATDADGALPLNAHRDGSADDEILRWTPGRPIRGPLTIRYRIPIENRPATRGAAPPIDLRRDDGAVSGSGATFLLLPENETPYRLLVRWDLSAFPSGAVGVSSFGVGDAATQAAQPAGRLQRSFFMAGNLGHYPAEGRDGAFLGAWQGRPPFDTRALMAWTSRLHGHFVRFFRETDPAPYTVFLRPNPVNPGGGVGLADSFVATFDEKTDPDDLRLTLSHEMFHTFSPRLSQAAGLESSWFSEGLAVFYQRELPFRFGEIDADQFLADLNSTAARYYTSIMAEVPNSEVAARFWEDTRIRTLPYDRGALYFADLDHRVRQASGGRRSLDDLMLAMIERQRQGRALANADWEELLERELGEAGVEHFRAFLAGTVPLPASDAFGPCFRRTTRPLRRYELGFEPRVLVEPRRIVRGLVPGSAAEQAGLRNGDEILQPVGQDSLQGDQAGLLTLQIRRGETTLALTYLPRGETVDAHQWERVEGVPDSACASYRQGSR